MNFLSQYMMFASAYIAHKPANDEAVFTTPGTYIWVAPPKVRNVSVVCIGGGASPSVGSTNFPGGGGGGLAYANDIPVTPGQSYTVIVGSGGDSVGSSLSEITGEDGESSSFDSSEITVVGYGGLKTGIGGTYSGDGGGNGGPANGTNGYGGGGAGGYTGDGGAGGQGADGGWDDPLLLVYPSGAGGDDGTGGAGGGGGGSLHTKYVGAGSSEYWSRSPVRGSSGGGTGIFGQGSDGQGSVFGAQWDPLSSSPPLPASDAGGGSGGGDSSNNGGAYGGGGRSGFYKVDSSLYIAGGSGGDGAVRIIWPGNIRQFPSINTQEI